MGGSRVLHPSGKTFHRRSPLEKVGGKWTMSIGGVHARASRQLATAEKTLSALMNARSFMH